MVWQKEVSDFPAALSFVKSMRHKSSDVIYVDHAVDHSMIELLMQLVESGMMVIAPFYSHTVARAVFNLVNRFPAPDRELASRLLANTLSIFFCQTLSYRDNQPYLQTEWLENSPENEQPIKEMCLDKLIIKKREAVCYAN